MQTRTETKTKRAKYMKQYEARPYVKAKRAKYEARPDVKSKLAAYRAMPPAKLPASPPLALPPVPTIAETTDAWRGLIEGQGHQLRQKGRDFRCLRCTETRSVARVAEFAKLACSPVYEFFSA